MKILMIGIAFVAMASCNNETKKTSETDNKMDTNQVTNSAPTEPAVTNTGANTEESMQEMVSQYLEIKNALANDKGKDAATAGQAFVESMGKMEKTSLPEDKKKAWDNLSDDAKEMAEHIATNGDKIEHQREHFDMLSKDMYDMVKAFGAGQTLYNDFCPMYNNKKGATRLSETKGIKNPYYGKKMQTCGTVKEEIK